MGKRGVAGVGWVCVGGVEGGGAVIQGVMPPAHGEEEWMGGWQWMQAGRVGGGAVEGKGPQVLTCLQLS